MIPLALTALVVIGIVVAGYGRNILEGPPPPPERQRALAMRGAVCLTGGAVLVLLGFVLLIVIGLVLR